MDFQPVVMAAGRGGRLAPLSDKVPKCLLPIGNVPMIWYPLRSLDMAGFTDVIVIVLKSCKDKIAKALEHMQKKVPWRTAGFSYKFHIVVDDCNEEEGTSSTLLKISEHMKSDLLVVSSDLITNLPLKKLLDKHCLHHATLTCLMRQQTKPDGAVPGPKTKNISKENDLVGIDSTDDRLLFIFAEADHEESIPLSQLLLDRHPCIDINSQLEDCHLYCISKAAIFNDDSKVRGCSSLRSELVPYLVSKQFEHSKHTHVEEESCIDDKLSMDLVTKLSSWTDHTGDLDGPYHDSKVRCYIQIAEQSQLCLRANSVPDYYEANKQIGAHSSYFGLTDFYLLPGNLKRSQAGSDCIIGDSLSLQDKSTIKKSMIGNDCVIGERVKINNSVIMNGVRIGDGSVIQTCIICDGSSIESKTELKESIIGTKQVVQSGKITNEVIADDDDEFGEP